MMILPVVFSSFACLFVLSLFFQICRPINLNTPFKDNNNCRKKEMNEPKLGSERGICCAE